MSDELRDRIADKIECENCCYTCRDGAEMAARAIVDDLGLTVHEVDRGNATKYVTKWLYP